MPINYVTVEYDIYEGEDPDDLRAQAIEHAQNVLFERALVNDKPLPTTVNVTAMDRRVDVWYEFQEERKIIFLCPQCDEQLIGHTRHQVRDLLAKHYELVHPEGE